MEDFEIQNKLHEIKILIKYCADDNSLLNFIKSTIGATLS